MAKANKCVNAKIEDVDELVNLFLLCFKKRYLKYGFILRSGPTKDLFEILIKNAEIKVIKEKGKIVAFVSYTKNLKELRKTAFRSSIKWFFPGHYPLLTPSTARYLDKPYVLFLGVHPDFQGKGYASGLQNYAIDNLPAPTYAEILCSNTPIKQLSFKNGFVIESKVRFGTTLLLRNDRHATTR